MSGDIWCGCGNPWGNGHVPNSDCTAAPQVGHILGMTAPKPAADVPATEADDALNTVLYRLPYPATEGDARIITDALASAGWELRRIEAEARLAPGREAALEAALRDIQTMAEADYGDDPLPDRMKVLLVLIPLRVEEALAPAEAPRLTERLERLVTDWESDGGPNPWSNDGWDRKEVQRECAAELRAVLVLDAPVEGT